MELNADDYDSDGARSRTASESERSTTSNLLDLAKAAEEKHVIALKKIEKTLEDKVQRDNSPEARQGRRIMALRAAYGEFMCTFLFLTPIFGCHANVYFNNTNTAASGVLSAFVGGFQVSNTLRNKYEHHLYVRIIKLFRIGYSGKFRIFFGVWSSLQPCNKLGALAYWEVE